MGNPVIDFYPGFHQRTPDQEARLVGLSSVVAVEPKPSAWLQDTGYFCKSARFVRHPVEDAVQINDVKGRFREFGQILGLSDACLEITHRFGSGDFHAQRQRVDADHTSRW